MAEQLEILVKALGLNSLDELKKKVNDGNISLNEMAKAKRQVNAVFRQTDLKAPEHKVLADVLATVNDRQRDVRIATKAGHEAYFKAGLELRQMALAGVGAGTALGKFSNILGDSVLNAVQLKGALVPLGIQMGGLGIGIAAVASAGIGLAQYFKQQSEEIAKIRREISELEAEIAKARAGTPSEKEKLQVRSVEEKLAQFRILKAEQSKLIQEDKDAEKTRAAQLLSSFGIGRAFASNQKRILEIDKEILSIEKELAEVDKERLATFNARLTAEIAREGFLSAMKQKTPEEVSKDLERTEIKKTGGRSFKAEFVKFDPSSTSFLTSEERKNIAANEERERKAKQFAEDIGSTLKSGATSFVSTLISGLITGKDIAQQLMAILLNVGITIATGGITKLLGLQSAGGGLEFVQPSMAAGRLSVPQRQRLPELKTVITKRELAIIVKEGDRQNRKTLL